MSGFSTLEIGKKALLAQRFGLDVTSNNIANVNTPGYSRRTAVISEDFSVKRNGFFMGNSAIVQKIQSYRNEYYDKEIRNITSRKSTFEVDTQFLKRIETTLGEPLNADLDSLVTDFFKSFDQAALNPDNVAFRSYIIDKGVVLAERFNSISETLNDLRRESLNSIHSGTQAVNQLLKEIVELNKQTAYNQNSDGSSSQKFSDERELKLQELAKFIDIKVGNNEDNTVNIFVNGINIVSGIHFSEIDYRISNNPTTNEKTVELFKKDIENGTETTLQTQAGEIFANMRLHNELLDNNDSSGNFSIASQFNEFVTTLAGKVNSIMATGYGMDDIDLSAPPPARTFFTSSINSTINASTISVNADLINNPKDLPLSKFANQPGNADISREIARIAEDKTFLNNLNPIEYYAGFISRIGSVARDAINGLSTTKLVNEQLDTQRESVMGVNLDEEAVNLIKFQKGFEAASRIINMTNEILSTLINLGK